jgi:hypothetical protein
VALYLVRLEGSTARVFGWITGDGRQLWGVRTRMLERVKGIEPSYEAWEAAVLPLNYTRDS